MGFAASALWREDYERKQAIARIESAVRTTLVARVCPEYASTCDQQPPHHATPGLDDF
jgi:hypothetical protein